MGLYINPPDKSKEQFLQEHGRKISEADAKAWNFAADDLPVCLVDNGAFTAAAIADRPSEVEAFTYGHDPRPRVWFAVKRDILAPYMKGAA